jgi:hypothetical protein
MPTSQVETVRSFGPNENRKLYRFTSSLGLLQGQKPLNPHNSYKLKKGFLKKCVWASDMITIILSCGTWRRVDLVKPDAQRNVLPLFSG